MKNSSTQKNLILKNSVRNRAGLKQMNNTAMIGRWGELKKSNNEETLLSCNGRVAVQHDVNVVSQRCCVQFANIAWMKTSHT